MADKTTLQEAAQALFCSVADYLGERETAKSFDSKKYKTYEDFMVLYTPPGRKNINQVVNEAFKSNVSTPGVSLKQIETFLQSDKSWFHSSMNIAKKMIQEVDSISNKFSRIQNVNWANIFYVRGDQEVMGNISTLFTRANNLLKEIQGKEQAFGNINKWSPADIYFASPKAKTVLADKVSKREKITFDELNELIANLIDSGDLLPLSLKKQTKEVTIEKVNFTAGKGEVPYIFAGFGGKEADARSLIVEISKTDKSKDIVIRHDASTGTTSGGTYKLEIRLKSARGGSLSGNKIVDTFKSIDSEFGAQFESTLADARVKFADEFAKRTKGITKATNPDRYRAIRDEVSKKYFTDSGPNKLIKDYLQKNSSNGKSTKLVKGIVVAAASGSDYSAKYVIAK